MLATFFLGMSSVDQETQVVWMPLQCSQEGETGLHLGSRELRAEVRLHVDMGRPCGEDPR